MTSHPREAWTFRFGLELQEGIGRWQQENDEDIFSVLLSTMAYQRTLIREEIGLPALPQDIDDPLHGKLDGFFLVRDDLSVGEKLAMLLDIQRSVYVASLIQQERHPDHPDKPADVE